MARARNNPNNKCQVSILNRVQAMFISPLVNRVQKLTVEVKNCPVQILSQARVPAESAKKTRQKETP